MTSAGLNCCELSASTNLCILFKCFNNHETPHLLYRLLATGCLYYVFFLLVFYSTINCGVTISNFGEHCFFNIICINVNDYFKILLPYLDFLLTAFTNFERAGRRIDLVSHLTKIISINIYRRTIDIVERQVWDDSSP